MAFFYATKVSVADQGTIVSVNETLQDVLSDIKNFSFLQISDNPIVEIKTTFKDDQGNQKIELVKPWGYGSVVDEPCLAAPTAAELAELIEKIRSLINRSEDILSENRALKLQLLGNGIYTTIDEAMQEVGDGSYFAVPSDDPDIFLELYLNDSGTAYLSDKIANWQLIDTAIASGDRAEIAAGEAEDSADYALASEQAAKDSEDYALASEQAAASSAQFAGTKAQESSTSADESAASASEALVSEGNALASEQAAKDSEDYALASEQAASLSEDAAALSETNAALSEQAAADSADYAASSEQVSELNKMASTDSASNAQASELAANTSASNASTSENNAAISEQNAQDSEDYALASEQAAKDSEDYALASEIAASDSADYAKASELAAADSATYASESEQNVINLESSVTGMYNSFDTKYLGEKGTDPATDNNGDPLLEGAFYYNTTLNVTKFYDGSNWYSPQEISTDAADSALVSEQAAALSESNAADSATYAASSEQNAATSESNAATSETNAADSETLAMAWADNSYGNVVVNGKYSARHWAVDADNSAAAAATSESNAAASEFAASNSEDAAATSETNAATSETNASTSESNALASENKAFEWAETNHTVEVETGQYSAKHWAIEAENSATAASTSETNASNSEDAAALSETNAATSETNASTSESNALSSENKAEKWAEENKDIEVETGKYSAKHYSEYAMQYRDEAQLSAQSLAGGMFFGGEWDASGGLTPLTPSEGSAFYKISVPGTINGVEYNIGDSIVYNNVASTWFKLDGSDKVDSVNGKIGTVVLTTDDVSEGNNEYYTNAKVLNAIKTDASWNASQWDTAYSWGDHALVGYALDVDISTVGKTGSWNDLLNKPSTFTPSAHTHDTSDITTGVFNVARIPTIDFSKASFADQNLNTNSTVKHAEMHIGGATDDGVNSHQVQGGSRTDTLAAGGVQNAQESIDTDGNVQVRGEGQLKMGNFIIQYDAATESLSFNMGA